MRIVDLTMTLQSGLRGVEFKPSKTIDKDGWNAQSLHLYSHCGTHMDAPLHFNASAQSIDRTPLNRCMGRAHVVDLTPIEPSDLIGVDDLGDVVDEFEEGDSLLLRTNWSAYIKDTKRYRDGLPRVSATLARWCVRRKVRMLGVEPPSIADVNNLEELTLIHQILLKGGVVIVEGLTGLDALPEGTVFFVAMPLKIANGDGAPCRAFAILGGTLSNMP